MNEPLVDAPLVPKARDDGDELANVGSSIKQEDEEFLGKERLYGRMLCLGDRREVQGEVRGGAERVGRELFQKRPKVVDFVQRDPTALKKVSKTRFRHFL